MRNYKASLAVSHLVTSKVVEDSKPVVKNLCECGWIGEGDHLCHCGCGGKTKKGNRFIRWHNFIDKNNTSYKTRKDDDSCSFGVLHTRIRNRLPEPDKCPSCGRKIRLDLCNISGKYHSNLEDWEYLCRKCHRSKYHPVGYWRDKHHINFNKGGYKIPSERRVNMIISGRKRRGKRRPQITGDRNPFYHKTHSLKTISKIRQGRLNHPGKRDPKTGRYLKKGANS